MGLNASVFRSIDALASDALDSYEVSFIFLLAVVPHCRLLCRSATRVLKKTKPEGEELMEAILQGDVEKAKALSKDLSCHSLVPIDDENGTILRMATLSGSLPLVAFLIDRETKQPGSKPSDFGPALVDAMSTFNSSMIDLVLQKTNISPRFVIPNGAHSFLHEAIRTGNIIALEALLKHSLQKESVAEADDRSVCGGLVQHAAAFPHAAGSLHLLLAMGFPAFSLVEDTSPLLFAIIGRNPQAVSMLLTALRPKHIDLTQFLRAASFKVEDAAAKAMKGESTAHKDLECSLMIHSLLVVEKKRLELLQTPAAAC